MTIYATGAKAETNISAGIAALSKLTISGKAKVSAYGETRGFYNAPSFGSSYTPKVKAGSSADSVSINKKKPAKSVYTKYKYVSITNAGSSSSNTSTTTGTGKPGKVKITKIKPEKGRFWIYWNQIIKNGKGYELQVCTSKKFKKKRSSVPSVDRNKTIAH